MIYVENFDRFCPIGPGTADEVTDPHNLGIRRTVNGEVLQDSFTDQLIFRVDQLIAYLSHVFTLMPGDLVLPVPPQVSEWGEPLRSGSRRVTASCLKSISLDGWRTRSSRFLGPREERQGGLPPCLSF